MSSESVNESTPQEHSRTGKLHVLMLINDVGQQANKHRLYGITFYSWRGPINCFSILPWALKDMLNRENQHLR